MQDAVIQPTADEAEAVAALIQQGQPTEAAFQAVFDLPLPELAHWRTLGKYALRLATYADFEQAISKAEQERDDA